MKRLVLACALLAALPLAAEQLPSRTRGLSADSIYQVGDIDNINLFNGNLSLAIPIGQSYAVSPQLSYRLTLVYNSNVWDYEDDHSCLDPSNTFRHFYIFPKLSRSSNAGAGWSLHFGRLFAPNDLDYNYNNPSWLFVGPDGSQHNFYDKLHPTESTTANVYYSLDGSYLRLDLRNSAQPILESPDGTVRTFSLAEGRYRLTEVKDRFGNWMRVSYTATTWQITDSQGRGHTVTLVTDDEDFTRVTRVDLEAFGGATATYNLTYQDASIERHRFDRVICDTDENHTEFQDGKLLAQLEQPDDSIFAFTYDTSDAASTSFSGALRSVSLPTGGRIEWDYATYGFQSQAPEVQLASLKQQRGVGARRTYLDGGSNVHGSFTYDYTPGYDTGPPGPFRVACWHRMRVSDNLSQQVTDSYFATAYGSDSWWYGLPYAPCDPGDSNSSPVAWSTGNSTPYLSTRVYVRQINGDLDPVRSTYVIYDSDGVNAGDRQDRNHRVRYQKVVYHDDEASPGVPHTEETIYSDFDGLGHYRSVSRKSSFGPEKAATTSYLPAGSYQLSPDTSSVIVDSFTVPGIASPWIHGLSSGSTTSQNGSISKKETCFDAATGFLLRQRVLAGSSQQAKDIVVEFEEGDDENSHGGFVVTERIYGGDDSANTTGGNLCGLSLDSPAFVKKNSYEYGSLKRSAWVEPCAEGDEVLVTEEAEIDQSTGLPATVVEPNGLSVSLSYDTLGRLLAEVPAEGASRIHKYVTSPPTYEIQHCPQGTDQFCQAAVRLSSRFWAYDGLGRMQRKALAYPGESGEVDPSVEYTLDGLGRKTLETTWGGAHHTTFGDFDIFGRARTIVPQGTESTLLTFRGERIKAREVKVATGSGDLTSVYATEEHDHHGRLVAVCDGASGVWDGVGVCSGQLTRYSYNHDDRLIHVCQNVSQTGACGQQRSFTWDGRGFLTSETHPEIGAAGNGTIDYQRDARGNPTYRNIRSDSGDRPLAWTYDRAGRPTIVEEQISTGWRKLKEFFYARTNVAGSSEKRRGQLIMARRINWLALLDPLLIEGAIPLTVTDHYQYYGLGGRVSKKTTSLHLSSGTQSWSTNFSYDALGNTATLDYPSGHWPYESTPARQVSFNHRLGFLNEIPGYADGITYQLGGMLYEIDYPNNVRWRQTAEVATGWERPDKIETLNAADQVLWSTGDYSFDGVSNISRIGNRSYTYDEFSRLKSSWIDFNTVAEQAATFDAYGNLIALAKNGINRVLTASTATNRLITTDTVYTSNGEIADVKIDGARIVYGYDGLGQQLFQQASGKTWVYAYDANDERVLSWECALDRCGTGTNFERYILRGLGGEVLRTFEGPNRSSLKWKEDFVYRDGQPLAWIKADPAGEKRLYLHADHLGSTRQITDATGAQVARHDFLPFGEESTASSSSDVALKFTGHERDQTGKPVDYMHARFCSPVLGRFLRVDPAGGSARLTAPQTWNRYAYVGNNPLAYRDPDGRESRAAQMLDQDIRALAAGQISIETYNERIKARGEGALMGLSFVPAATEVVLGGLGSLGGRLLGAASLFRRGEQIQGMFGTVARATLEKALQAGGSKTKIVTSLSSAPQSGRALSVAVGDDALALAKAARPDGKVFQAEIPDKFLDILINKGLAEKKTTYMAAESGQWVRSTEIRFHSNVTEFIVDLFGVIP